MDQQAGEQAKAAGTKIDGAGTVGEESKEASSEATTAAEAEVEVEVKQEQGSPISPSDDVYMMQPGDKNKECKYHNWIMV